MLYHGLYILAAPQMQFLLSGTAFLSFTVQMFKDDGINIIEYCGIYDETGSFDSNIIVDTFRYGPESGCFEITVLLSLPDPVRCMLQRVVFSGQLTEMPAQDRAIRMHDGNRSCGINTKVNSSYRLMKYICIRKNCFFLKGKIQIPFMAPFSESRSTFLTELASTCDVINIRLTKIYCDPVPGIVNIYFDPGLVGPVCSYIPVLYRHG